MADRNEPGVGIVIPHYNDVRRLLRCLEGLMPQVGPDDEVVVVDNGSTESLDPVRAAFPDLRIVVESEKGAGAARNRGVAETTAALMMFIDSDCVPAPDWVETGRRIAQGDAVIGGRVDLFDETPPPRSGAEAFEWVFAFRTRDYAETKGFLASCSLVTSRALFDEAGGFRTGVSEDVEWSRRVTDRGFRIGYDDSFAVAHPTRSDWAALRRKWRRLTSEGFLLQGTDPVSRVRWAGRALLMPASVLVHLPRALADGRLAPRERIAAAGTLLRLRLARMTWMLGQSLTGRP